MIGKKRVNLSDAFKELIDTNEGKVTSEQYEIIENEEIVQEDKDVALKDTSSIDLKDSDSLAEVNKSFLEKFEQRYQEVCRKRNIYEILKEPVLKKEQDIAQLSKIENETKDKEEDLIEKVNFKTIDEFIHELREKHGSKEMCNFTKYVF